MNKYILNFPRSLWNHSFIFMINNTASMILSMVITSSLGSLYWWIAAHQYSPEAVGLASATVSAMMLLGTIGTLGLGTFLIGELPRQTSQKGTLITTALLVSGIVSLALGFVFVLLMPNISAEIGGISRNVGNVALFIIGVSLTSIGYVSDQATIGLLRSDLQLWRNTIHSVMKIGLLVAFGLWSSNRSGMAIFSTWVFGGLISLLSMSIFAIPKIYSSNNIKPDIGVIYRVRRLMLEHHALNLALQAPGLVLPVLVTTQLSARMNAYFYTSWMVATLTFIGSAALTTVLYAVGASNPESLGEKVRMSLKLSTLMAFLTSGALLFGSELILGFFGASYAQQAGWCLRILGLGVFPLVIKNHFVAICRIDKRISEAAKWMTVAGMIEFILAGLGGYFGGLNGLAVGWLIAVSSEAFLMTRAVYRKAVI